MSHKRYLMCVHCDPAIFLSDIPQLNKHLRTAHPHLQSYQCGHCKTLCVHKTSLIRHIEVHAAKDDAPSGGSSPSQSNTGDDSDQDTDTTTVLTTEDVHIVGEETNENNDNFVLVQQVPPAPAFDIKTEAGLFLLKLRSSGNITHASVRLIQDFVAELLQNILQDAGSKTIEFLDSCGVTPEQSAPFVTGNTFSPGNPFDGLETLEDQLNYFCDKYGMVIPEEKFLGFRIENRFDREKRMFIPKQVTETFQYVSVIETLKLILSNAAMRCLIESEEQSSDGVYRSYKDGSDFKANCFLKKYPNAIRIVIYLDDLEIANALGSKDVIHKLGCFYFSIQNLPAEESSQLSSVFLFALTYAEDLKTPGVYAKVLKPLADEVKKLMSEEGVVLNLPEGGTYTIRACLVCLCADSLAAHSILGFMSPSANMFCRCCLVSKKDLCGDSAAMGMPRTTVLQKEHVRQVEENPALRSKFGVDQKSALVDVLRVPEDCAFDAFHDLVGVIQMDIKLALYEYICVRKLFTAPDFNASINMFQYGKPDSRNKPSPNFMYRQLCEAGHSFKQSGSQTFCLLRVFPFLVTGVEAGDPYLELIFLLQDIVRISLSFEATDAHSLTLDNLVLEHNNLFHRTNVAPVPAAPIAAVEVDSDGDGENEELISDEDGESGQEEEEGDDGEDEEEEEVEQVEPRRRRRRRKRKRLSKVLKKGINKMHHLLHYGAQLRQKGPIVRLWCAKYEGKHRLFRKHSGVQCNFKNPPKTMAKMFQLSTLAPLLAKKQIRKAEHISLTTGATKTLVENHAYKDMLLNEGLNQDDKIEVVQSAEWCGEEYSPGLFVVLTGGPNPQFALIEEVLVINKPAEPGKLLLIVLKCQNKGLCPRYNSYAISNEFTSAPELVNVQQLKNFRAIAPWSPVGSTTSDTLYLYPRTVFV